MNLFELKQLKNYNREIIEDYFYDKTSWQKIVKDNNTIVKNNKPFIISIAEDITLFPTTSNVNYKYVICVYSPYLKNIGTISKYEMIYDYLSTMFPIDKLEVTYSNIIDDCYGIIFLKE